MTNRELQEELKKFPDDAIIKVPHPWFNKYMPIQVVELTKDIPDTYVELTP